MTTGIQPMLDYVGLEQPEGAWLPGDGSYRLVVDRYRIAWVDFKEFTPSTAHEAIVHALT